MERPEDQETQPGCPHCRALAITPIFRSDGSGDTYAFTNYLSKVSKAWKTERGFATTVSFPAGVGAKGNVGVTSAVQSTNGAIGYISASYLIAAGLKAAAVQNEAGKFTFPNLKNISAAAEMVKKVPANNELHIVDPPKKYTDAYPISTFTYCIVPHGAPKKAELEQFINYKLTNGQKYGPALDFAPLPQRGPQRRRKAPSRVCRDFPSGGRRRRDTRATRGLRPRGRSAFRRRPGWRGGGGRR